MAAQRLDNWAEASEQIGRQCEARMGAVSRDEACWPRSNARCNCRVRNRLHHRRAAAGCRARRNIWHAYVDYLSRATLDACEERRDKAERRKFKFFHKSLRLLNITKVSSLQALTETLSKLFRSSDCLLGQFRWDAWLSTVKDEHASCNRQSEIY